jgi:hypothetical protein
VKLPIRVISDSKGQLAPNRGCPTSDFSADFAYQGLVITAHETRKGVEVPQVIKTLSRIVLLHTIQKVF